MEEGERMAGRFLLVGGEREEPPALTSCMTVPEPDGKGSKKVLEYRLNG